MYAVRNFKLMTPDFFAKKSSLKKKFSKRKKTNATDSQTMVGVSSKFLRKKEQMFLLAIQELLPVA